MASKGEVYVGLGNIAVRKDQNNQAIAMWTIAVDIFKKLGIDEQVRQIEKAVRKVWPGTGIRWHEAV